MLLPLLVDPKHRPPESQMSNALGSSVARFRRSASHREMATAPADNRAQLVPAFSRLLASDGRVAAWPGRKHRQALEAMLAPYVHSRLLTARAPGTRMSQEELTALMVEKAVASSPADAVLLRREMVERGFLGRDDLGAEYWIQEGGGKGNPWANDRSWIAEVVPPAAKPAKDATVEGGKAEETGE
ncbi:hypothetical protein DFJ74DRAFT_365092 [Hyaloraphidium curvatum]|nr:hypothetical protein DFJ74DRAFT_365092 [Hyaloraphidium curvatum]